MNGKLRLLRFAIILVVAGIVYWQRNLDVGESSSPDWSAPALQGSGEKVRGYDKFIGARLVDEEGNDGDSFTVLADGREFVLRLYFVDAPEKYLSDTWESQQRRVADQAKDMGGISVEQAVDVGLEAKAYTNSLLKGKPFTVYTYWESVYDSDRYYGFVELSDGEYLGTKLVRDGLARIHTKGPGSKEKPVPTPDGSSFHQHRDMLYRLESEARRSSRGAYGY